MEIFLITMKNPIFLKFLENCGGIIFAFNLIRLIAVTCKIKNAVIYLYQGAEAFDGMCFGCSAIAFSAFMQEKTIVGIIAIVLAAIFFCCDRKFTWIRQNNDALQEAQTIINKEGVKKD